MTIHNSVARPRTLRDWILWAENEMNGADVYFGHGTDNALDEAAWLAGGVLGLSPQQLDAHLQDVLTPAQQQLVREVTQRRIDTRKPAAYLLNEAWFAGMPFFVDERVIVPRSLTGEFILERFEPWIDSTRVRRVLDLCTGSGCMAIACAHSFPQASVDAVDISDEALAVAGINVERHALADRVHLVRSDLFDALGGRRYDVIVTNPPYVGQEEMDTLPVEYRHEPTLALQSGTDGLDAVVRLLAQAADHLEPHGILVVEVGNSNEILENAFPQVPFLWLTTAAGDDSVFLLNAAQLAEHRQRFVSALRTR